jgi:uncharacterized protein (TIGR03437 family)
LGAHVVSNSYSGDGNYLPTTATPLTLTVVKGTAQFSVLLQSNVALQQYNFTFTVTGTGVAAAPTGTVTCAIPGLPSQTATIANGSGSLLLAPLPPGTYAVTCTYSGDSNYPTVTGPALTVTFTPMIFANGVVGAAGVNSGVAPGSLISIFGMSLQGTVSTTGAASAPSIPLPVTLGGAQLLVNGAPAPLLYVAPGQINAQAPFETPVGTPVQVVVVSNGISSQPVMVTFSSYAPSVFLYPRTATSNDPVIVHGSSNTLVTPASPAQPGEVLVIYATGAGKLTNQPLDGAGAPTSPLATTVDTPSVTVGGASTTVQFSGLAPGFVGLLQINVQMPAVFPASTTTPPSLPLVITFPGGVSAPVNLWVQ